MDRHVRVAVVGAGFGGIGTAVRLIREGVEDLVVLEKADAVGGVWQANVYPGAACDVESHLYALADAPNPDWSRWFSPQPEIRSYLERVADEHGVTERLHLGTEVTRAEWDAGAARWRLATDRGPWTADVLVSAVGGLAEPRIPPIPGLDRFAGVVMHTARWDPDLDLDDARVAVIGTGASAAQLVPALQERVPSLTVFQRTPTHVIPRRDRALADGLRQRLARWPRVQRALRAVLHGRHEVQGLPFRLSALAPAGAFLARRHLRRQVRDPDLRRRLTPEHRFGCKRIVLSDDYYPALERPNVTLTSAAAEVRSHVVMDADGTAHPADLIALATGFHVHDFPFTDRIVGREGRSLAEVWDGSPRAHVGTTVAGFPNLFVIQGPNTGLGHSSVILMMEAQIEHLVGALVALDREGAATVEPTPEAQRAFVEEVDQRAEGTTWMSGCQSWYLDDTGRNAAIWPGSVASFQRRVAPFDPADYVMTPVLDAVSV